MLDFTKEKYEQFEYEFNQEDNKSKYLVEYDNNTQECYRVMRKLKIGPMSNRELDDNAFKFLYQWDSYTGIRSNKLDPYGPFYFDPVYLARYFITNILRNLWVEQDGNWSGYYDNVGCGESFYIKGQGHSPEKYLFRIPLLDCYLEKDHGNQIITIGAKLTNDEIKEIDDKVQSADGKERYRRFFGKNPPSLVGLKHDYDLAISKFPVYNVQNDVGLSSDEVISINNKANRRAVDNIRRIISN